MEGVSIPMDKNLMFNSGNMRSTTNFFRPMFVKRSVSDLVSVPRKKLGKSESDAARQNSRAGSQVPVVSVQYDVPRTPPSPLMYRIRRLNTPQSNFMSSRSKTEDRISKYIELFTWGSFQRSHELYKNRRRQCNETKTRVTLKLVQIIRLDYTFCYGDVKERNASYPIP